MITTTPQRKQPLMSNQLPRSPGYDLILERIESGLWSVDPEQGIIYGARGNPIGSRRNQYKPYIRVGVDTQMKSPKVISVQAHRVIWESVHGPVPAGHLVIHANGVKHDNRISNLMLVTPAQCEDYIWETGLKRSVGCFNGRAKITCADAAKIRELYAAGNTSCPKLGEIYGLEQSTVNSIVRGAAYTRCHCDERKAS